MPPADWFSPVPVPWLAVADGQGFQFALIPTVGTARRQDSADDESDVAIACKWLQEALDNLGIGAKTAIDRGRFVSETSRPIHSD